MVLDAPDDGHGELVEHGQHLLGIEVGGILGGNHDESAAERQPTGQLLLSVGGTRWQVDDEEVDLAPGDSIAHAASRVSMGLVARAVRLG